MARDEGSRHRQGDDRRPLRAKAIAVFGYEDGGPGSSVKMGWCKSGGNKNPASMSDTPEKVSGTDNTFEACAIAKSGADAGTVYGCVVWGFTEDDNRVASPKKTELKVTAGSEFEAAARKWNVQAGGGGGHVAGQESLPALK